MHQSASKRIDEARAYRLDESFARVPIDLHRSEIRDGVVDLSASAPGATLTEIVLPCEVHEHFAGCGEQFTQVDKRGRVIDGLIGVTANKPAAFAHGLDGGYKIGPYFYSSAGYALFVETTLRYRFMFAVADPHEVVIRLPADEIRVTIIAGHPAEAVQMLTELTGRPPLAPPWAYGVWHGIRGGDDAVRAEARRLRDEQVPVSAIWLDAHWEPETNSGFPAAGTYELGEYPDISQTVAALHGLGFKALTYVSPYMYMHTPAHDHARENGYLVSDARGNPLYVTMLHPTHGDDMHLLDMIGAHSLADGVGLVDLTNPEARAWWQSLLRRILTEEGFDGWMEDFGEGVPAGAVLHDGTTEAESHNRYPLLYHEASMEEIRRTKPDALFFARGGFLGAQALAPVFWPGDQTRDWSAECGLASLPAAGISLALMGVAAWGSDIGANMGFPTLGGGLGGGSQDKELWIRWCQMGAMSPVMRDHLSFHSGVPVDLWTDEETIDAWRRSGSWHVALFPYLYAAAKEATDTGLPIIRGMMIHFPDHPESWVLNDQYMLGDALLCAPVIRKGERTRRIWLPDGDWYDIWTGDRHAGPGWTEVPAPIERWPVLQRSGTVVPMLADVPLDLNDASYAEGTFDVELRVVPGRDSERVLHDGTRIGLTGRTVEISGPRSRSYSTATVDGQRIDAGAGETLTLKAAP